MTTRITFNDGAAAVLTNGKPSPADRFTNWVPRSTPIGDFVERQSDGAVSGFLFRTDHGATFELTQIPVKTSGGVRLVDVANRLIAHLRAGGQCNVETGDVDGSTYATCGLMPGADPLLGLTDRTELEYTLSLALINLAGGPVAMVCHYVA